MRRGSPSRDFHQAPSNVGSCHILLESICKTPEFGLSCDFFHFRSCRVDGACISSTNFPGNYPDNDECDFQAPPLDLQHPLAIEVVSFSTQSGHDFLQVDGELYSGEVGPERILPEGTISWRADARHEPS